MMLNYSQEMINKQIDFFTKDCGGCDQASIFLKQGFACQTSMWFIGIGFKFGAFNPGPCTNHTIPANYTVQNTAMFLEIQVQ